MPSSSTVLTFQMSSSRLSFSQRLQRSRQHKPKLPVPSALRPGPGSLTIAEFQDPASFLPQGTPVSAQFFRSKLPQGRDLLVLRWASGHFVALGVARPNRHGVHLLGGGGQVPALEGRTTDRRTFTITHAPSKLVLRLTASSCKISP